MDRKRHTPSSQVCTDPRAREGDWIPDGLTGHCIPSATDGTCIWCEMEIRPSCVETQDGAYAMSADELAWIVVETIAEIERFDIDKTAIETLQWSAQVALDHRDTSDDLTGADHWMVVSRLASFQTDPLDKDGVMTIKWRAEAAVSERMAVA